MSVRGRWVVAGLLAVALGCGGGTATTDAPTSSGTTADPPDVTLPDGQVSVADDGLT